MNFYKNADFEKKSADDRYDAKFPVFNDIHINLVPDNGEFCCLVVIYANSLDTDQAR